MNKSEIVFLIRTFNEWRKIWEVIETIINSWYNNILIIDDGSIDNTKKIIKSIKNKNIIYLKHLFNRWGGAALETWFEYLRKYHKVNNLKYIVTFDADWQHSIKDIDKFINKFEKNEDLDIVLGSRFIKKTNSNVPFLRKIILYWWRIFTYIISWIKLTDSHNGYRMIKINSLKKIKLTMDWMEYASELIEQIKVNKLAFTEVPVNIEYTEYSLNKWQKSSNALNIALKMIWNKFFK